MDIKKKFGIFILLTMVLCSLVGCRKVVNTEEKEVEVTITDTHYRGSRSFPQRIGKTTTIRFSSVEYKVYVAYEGKTYTIDNEDSYNQYKDCVGETVIDILKTVTYDDGSTSSRIVGLK